MTTPTKRKVLISSGYGAGWVTWNLSNTVAARRFMLTYAPFIEALEAGTKGADLDLEQFEKDFEAAFPGEETPYTGGAESLEVVEVTGQIHVTEYDGSESYIERGDDEDQWL